MPCAEILSRHVGITITHSWRAGIDPLWQVPSFSSRCCTLPATGVFSSTLEAFPFTSLSKSLEPYNSFYLYRLMLQLCAVVVVCCRFACLWVSYLPSNDFTASFLYLQRDHVPQVIKKKTNQSGKVICNWSLRQGSQFLQMKRILSKNKRSDSKNSK